MNRLAYVLPASPVGWANVSHVFLFQNTFVDETYCYVDEFPEINIDVWRSACDKDIMTWKHESWLRNCLKMISVWKVSCVYLIQLKLVTTETPKTKLCPLSRKSLLHGSFWKTSHFCLVFGLQGLQAYNRSTIQRGLCCHEIQGEQHVLCTGYSCRFLFWSFNLLILLMVQKSQGQPRFGCFWNVVNNGINYQPQLVCRISELSTVFFFLPSFHAQKMTGNQRF